MSKSLFPSVPQAALPHLVTYRVAFLLPRGRASVALVEAESPEDAVARARWGLPFVDSLEVVEAEVQVASHSVRDVLDG